MGFIYSLTNRSFSLMRGLFTILFGVALILWPEHLHKIIIMVVASFSVAAGLISTLVLMKSYKVEQETGIIVLKIIEESPVKTLVLLLCFKIEKILETIVKKFNGGPVGLQALAASTSEEKNAILEIYEPYLIQLGLIKRTSKGRIASELAYKHLNLKWKNDQQNLL